MDKIIIRTTGIISLVLFFGCTSPNKNHHKSNNKYHQQIKPIIWGCNPVGAEQKLKDFSSTRLEPHPLDLGRFLFYVTYKYEQTADAKFKELANGYISLIDTLTNNPTYFSDNTFKYNFAHGKIKAGWWSGMANSAMVAGLSYADKVFGSNHNDIIDSLITNLTTSYEKGGSLYSDSEDKAWILEYAWKGMDEASIKSVFNGFVFALVCLERANMISPNPKLEKLILDGKNALEEEVDQFYFEDIEWTKYDLLPTIEPPHYAIFDIMLLEALNGGQEWVLNDLERRRRILKNGYRFNAQINEDGRYSMLFSLIGPPHPYWIDTYPLEMEAFFSFGKKKIFLSNPPKDFDVEISKRGFVAFDLTEREFNDLKKIEIQAVYSGERQKVATYGKKEISIITYDESAPNEIDHKELIVGFDAYLDGHEIAVDPNRKYDSINENYRNNIAQIIIPFRDGLQLKENENLILKTEFDFDVSPHRFYLYTENGKVYDRYYLPLRAGKNIVVLNPVGFSEFDVKENIVKLAWRIYTNKMTNKGRMKWGGIYKTKNNFQLKKILDHPEFLFEEKRVGGNIY
ncbi:D-glucuronyl C5-epimerase family protein [Flagellimonas sp.]|uniref:D-glucuronyl C5-epimerase family protein n=1 Tax=Flagellimonas sp. TaxID=2058762 RepID=UPI003BA9F1D8